LSISGLRMELGGLGISMGELFIVPDLEAEAVKNKCSEVVWIYSFALVDDEAFE
jgi:hypothetical protein